MFSVLQCKIHVFLRILRPRHPLCLLECSTVKVNRNRPNSVAQRCRRRICHLRLCKRNIESQPFLPGTIPVHCVFMGFVSRNERKDQIQAEQSLQTVSQVMIERNYFCMSRIILLIVTFKSQLNKKYSFLVLILCSFSIYISIYI